MPNIRRQEVTKDLLYIQASDGREFTMTRAEVQAIWQAQTGNAAARKAATIAIVKAQIEAALGAEQVSASILIFDFNTGDLNASLTCGTQEAP